MCVNTSLMKEQERAEKEGSKRNNGEKLGKLCVKYTC